MRGLEGAQGWAEAWVCAMGEGVGGVVLGLQFWLASALVLVVRVVMGCTTEGMGKGAVLGLWALAWALGMRWECYWERVL